MMPRCLGRPAPSCKLIQIKAGRHTGAYGGDTGTGPCPRGLPSRRWRPDRERFRRHIPEGIDMATNRTRGPLRRWVFWAFLGLAAFYLIVEHRAHLAGSLSWLPLGFLLLCPLMHAFGHGGHAHGSETRPGALPDDDSDRLSGGR